ncbi:MAG: hypothetical protein HYX29_08415 [Solirubrobacterales bacterium]|nr:hypothetical protein [Solirubrobacterales bacterium]
MLLNTDQEVATYLDLREAGSFELLSFFRDLPSPGIKEMNGDYDATLLQQPSLAAEINGFFAVGLPFSPWLSKGFRPVNETEGRGYNSFRQLGKVIQRYPMRTMIAPSRYDGRDSYTLIYRAYRSMCGAINMVDEIRRVNDGLYLAIGTWGFTKRQRQIPLPFALRATDRPYAGDIGTPAASFVPSVREVPALTVRSITPLTSEGIN